MLEITQLSGVAQFLFFMGCGYLVLQLPFGWIAALLGLLLVKGLSLSSNSVWGLPLNVPGAWISYLVISALFIGLGFAFLGKFPHWLIPVFFGMVLLLSLVGIVFSVYTLFKATATFPLDIGIKILAFLVGAFLGAASWVVLHTVTLLSAISSSYSPVLIVVALAVSILCAAIVMLGTYFMVVSPKAGYWVLGCAGGIILILFFNFVVALANSRWT